MSSSWPHHTASLLFQISISNPHRFRRSPWCVIPALPHLQTWFDGPNVPFWCSRGERWGVGVCLIKASLYWSCVACLVSLHCLCLSHTQNRCPLPQTINSTMALYWSSSSQEVGRKGSSFNYFDTIIDKRFYLNSVFYDFIEIYSAQITLDKLDYWPSKLEWSKCFNNKIKCVTIL